MESFILTYGYCKTIRIDPTSAEDIVNIGVCRCFITRARGINVCANNVGLFLYGRFTCLKDLKPFV